MTIEKKRGINMKTNTILKIVTVFVISVAMTMSGCLDTYDISDSNSEYGNGDITSVIDSVTSPSDTMLVKIDIDNKVLEFKFHDNGTAVYITPSNGGYSITGTWKISERLSDHKVYTMDMKDTASAASATFKLDIYNDGHATLHFPSFSNDGTTTETYGVWERVSGNNDFSPSALYMFNGIAGIPIPPLDVTFDLGTAGTIQVALNDDGSAVVNTIVDGRTKTEDCKWCLINADGSARIFDLVGLEDFTLGLRIKGGASGNQMGSQYFGTWEKR